MFGNRTGHASFPKCDGVNQPYIRQPQPQQLGTWADIKLQSPFGCLSVAGESRRGYEEKLAMKRNRHSENIAEPCKLESSQPIIPKYSKVWFKTQDVFEPPSPQPATTNIFKDNPMVEWILGQAFESIV